jgi:hypothetical protein
MYGSASANISAFNKGEISAMVGIGLVIPK